MRSASPRVPGSSRDPLIAVTVAALSLIAPVTGGQGPAASGGAWSLLATAAALGQGLPLAWRARHPRASAAVVLGSFAVSSGVVGVAPPIGPWVATWSLATGSHRDVDEHPIPATRPRRQALMAALVTCLILAAAEIAHPGGGASTLLVLLTALVTMAALLVRADHARVAAVREAGATDERLRIARDLHDAVGHGLGVVAVQSSVARMALERGDPTAARAAIAAVESASRTAMREMRQMLGVLTSQQDTATRAGIDGIAELVAASRRPGLDIVWEPADGWQAASPAVQLCAYRVVQEALTNVLKHEAATTARVGVVVLGDELHVSVQSSGADSGGAPAGVLPTDPDHGGLGLPGLRARVAGVGGRLQAGPTEGGWVVRAAFPMAGGRR